jgi:hypothetical protein
MALDEAARQLKSAAHDAQVAFDCLGLGDLERAQIHAITARAAADAAEAVLREALSRMPAGDAEIEGEQAVLDAEGGSSDGSVIASYPMGT